MRVPSHARFRLANLPTPIQPLPRLSEKLGIQLSVKRDDLTGLAFGGNKTRKLELLVADALAQGARSLVTVGAQQSNHCRQTAAAAAQAGLGCTLVLGGSPPDESQGNLLLDVLLGAEIVWSHRSTMLEALEEICDQLEKEGREPYRVPYGGSGPLGVVAYAAAMEEAVLQGLEADLIIVASSSGGTQAGMLLGASILGVDPSILGISVDPSAADLSATISGLLEAAIAFEGLAIKAPVSSIQVTDAYLGAGYALMGNLEREAIGLFASQEGIILDPVYSGRAAGGLLDLVRSGAIRPGEKVVFWHTGGTPALFASAQELHQPQ